MTVENRPQLHSYPEPSQEDASEMSFEATMRQAVDDLCTHRDITEKLKSRSDDTEVKALLETWKQDLTQNLIESAQSRVGHIVATLDLIQSEEYSPISEAERQEWANIEQRYQSFTVASVCREDLRGILTQEEISTLNDHDMERIADKMNDAYQEHGGYWENLTDIARLVIAEKQNTESSTTQSDGAINHPPTEHHNQ